ncbi:hypothetical protein C8Q76DRAFT_57557 [Earliella scabrosa]|nr:hypothetical protein C8Q76DRAFT_57557 [Earliella scabrosa]
MRHGQRLRDGETVRRGWITHPIALAHHHIIQSHRTPSSHEHIMTYSIQRTPLYGHNVSTVNRSGSLDAHSPRRVPAAERSEAVRTPQTQWQSASSPRRLRRARPSSTPACQTSSSVPPKRTTCPWAGTHGSRFAFLKVFRGCGARRRTHDMKFEVEDVCEVTHSPTYERPRMHSPFLLSCQVPTTLQGTHAGTPERHRGLPERICGRVRGATTAQSNPNTDRPSRTARSARSTS